MGEAGSAWPTSRRVVGLQRNLGPPLPTARTLKCMNTISRTLALLKPADLFPAWKWIDMMEGVAR